MFNIPYGYIENKDEDQIKDDPKKVDLPGLEKPSGNKNWN